MKNFISNYWQVGLFYLIIIVGVLSLNIRFKNLNETSYDEVIAYVDITD